MTKKILCVLLAGAVSVSFCSCKPATVETEEKVKEYESKLEKLDISGDKQEDADISGNTLEDTDISGNTLKVQLSDTASVDAIITPSAYYQGKIGIYEFERADLGFEEEEFLEKVNEYYGRQEVGYEDTSGYQLEVTSPDQDLEPTRINCYNVESGGYARYCRDAVNSENYYYFLLRLIDEGYPVYKQIETQDEGVPGNVKKLVDLINGSDAGMGGELLSLTSEEEYLRMEAAYKRISDPSDDHSEEELETRLANMYETLEGDFQNHPPAYGVQCYELVGDTHIPLKNMNGCSYINRKGKEIPATSVEEGGEVSAFTDNYIYMYFSENDELEVLDLSRQVKVSEKPVKEVEVIDARKVIDIFYQRVKAAKHPNILYSVQLQYSGVVKEEDGKLEDYIYPVWTVKYYDSTADTLVQIYLDGVTGEELPKLEG